MSYFIHVKIIVLLVLSLFLLAGFASAEETMDTRMHSMLMLNKAVSKHRHQTDRPFPDSHSARLRENRNSGVATHHRESGEGVSIGNVYAQPGTNSQHSSNVIITGPILVTGKR